MFLHTVLEPIYYLNVRLGRQNVNNCFGNVVCVQNLLTKAIQLRRKVSEICGNKTPLKRVQSVLLLCTDGAAEYSDGRVCPPASISPEPYV